MVDITSPYLNQHIATTQDVLHQIGAADKNIITVFNKIDLVKKSYLISRIRRRYSDGVFISTKTNEGIADLLEAMAEMLDDRLENLKLRIPVDRYNVVALLHRTCDVRSQCFENGAVLYYCSGSE